MFNFLKQGNRLFILMIITVVIFVIIVLDMMPDQARTSTGQVLDSTVVYVSSGPDGSTDNAVGTAISGLIKESGIKSSVQESSGSAENMDRVINHETNLALIYASDMVGYEKDMVIMAETGQSLLYILAGEDIDSFSDLQGKVIAVGEENSSAHKALLALCGMYEIAQTDITPIYGNAISLLENGKAEAAFVIGESAANLPEGYGLVPVDVPIQAATRVSGWQEGTIPAGFYGNDLDIPTLSSKRYLVADPAYPEGAREVVQELLDEKLDETLAGL